MLTASSGCKKLNMGLYLKIGSVSFPEAAVRAVRGKAMLFRSSYTISLRWLQQVPLKTFLPYAKLHFTTPQNSVMSVTVFDLIV